MRWRTLNRRKARRFKKASAVIKPGVWPYSLYSKDEGGGLWYVGRVHLPNGALTYEGKEYIIAPGPVDLLSLSVDGVTVSLDKVNEAACTRFEVEFMDWPDELKEVAE